MKKIKTSIKKLYSNEKLRRISKVFIIPLILTIFYFLISFGSVQNLSATVDEKFHLVRGIMLLETGDYRINAHHPVLFNVITALPTLFDDDLVIPSTESEEWKVANKDLLSFDLVDINGGIVEFSENVLPYPRLVMILIATMFIPIFYTVIRRIFSFKAALLATLLLVLSPAYIAHGAMVTTDMPATMMIFLTTIALYKYMTLDAHGKPLFWKIQPKHVYLFMFTILGVVALLSKYTTVMIAPLWIVFLWIYILREPRKAKLFPRLLKATATVGAVIVSWMVIMSAVYAFQFNTIEDMAYGNPAKLEKLAQVQDEIEVSLGENSIPSRVYGFIIYEIKTPFPQFVFGFYDNVFLHDKYGHRSFLLGEFRDQGWWYYFPVAYLIKEPIAAVILLVISLIVTFGDFHKKYKKKEYPKISTVLLFAVPGFLLLLSMLSSLNLGIRHILPLFPFMFLLIGWSSAEILKKADSYKYFLMVLYIFMFLSVVLHYPNYIGYFNESIGKSTEGYKYLRSSNLDWEQNTLLVNDYVLENSDETLDDNVISVERGFWGEDFLIIRIVTLFNPEEIERLEYVKYTHDNYESGKLNPIDKISNTHLVFENNAEMKSMYEEKKSQ